MIQITKHIVMASIFFMCNLCFTETKNPNKDIETVVEELVRETTNIINKHNASKLIIHRELYKIREELKYNLTNDYKLKLLIEKDLLNEKLKYNELLESAGISKIRYLKGLQIIKILYEKTLTLDHHFASVATFNEINNLSNPNNYPEFAKLKGVLKDKQDKKEGFNLSNILGNNVYTNVIHSFVSLFNNESTSKKDKEKALEEAECIIDFTLRMHNDLNVIYFETAFLKKSNENILQELEQLFIDYIKPINYKTPLKECRNTDDWDVVRDYLNNYIEVLDSIIEDESQRFKAHKMQIDLEFPIDRLLQFVTQYNVHIDQGGKFYEKFGIMLNSYENEKQCATKIPLEYNKLKQNIEVSIDKFNTAYKPVEINGSKMKQVLYGINEY